MDLEQRIQSLEQEMQILKNQIQITLLDIQEQVLANNHQGLRSGDNSVSARPAPSNPPPDVEEHTQMKSPVRKVSFKDLHDEDDDDPPPMPEVRPTRSNNRPQMSAQQPGRNGRAAESNNMQRASRVPQALNTQSSRLQAAGVTVQDFGDADYDETPTQPSRPEGFPTQMPPQGVRPPPAPRPKPVQAKPAQPTAAAPARPQPAAAPRPKPVQAKPAAAQPRSQLKPRRTDGDSRKTVLRLIAGVQNAGAGMRWGKKKS